MNLSAHPKHCSFSIQGGKGAGCSRSSDNGDEWVASWMERAEVNSGEVWNKANNTTEAKEISCTIQCPCGVPYMPKAVFCFMCRSRKPEVGPTRAKSPSFGEECKISIAATPGDCKSEEWSPGPGLSVIGTSTSLRQIPYGEGPSNEMFSRQTTCGDASNTGESTSIEGGQPAPTLLAPPGDMNSIGASITTMMLSGIPCRLNIEKLIEAINAIGFADTYDLVYLPPQNAKGFKRAHQNNGYAFVNFKNNKFATAFQRVFYDFTFPDSLSKKLSYATPAQCQGFDANLEMHSKQKRCGNLFTF